MKKFVISLTLCAACVALADESTTKITARPFRWESVVKPDAPPPSAQQAVQATLTEVASKVSSIPLYYSAQREVPPLPFNPYPELQLFDIGDNKFVYDDRAVDYFSLFASPALASESGGMSAMSMAPPCDPCSTNGSGGGGPVNFGGPAYSYSSTQLWVKITSTNTTNFLLDVNNTVPGVTYGVGAKSTVDTDPFNTWTLVNVFEATSTNQQLSGTASAATRFYNAVNLDAYVGPSVSIVSPASGATVSNDVTLQVRVTDILPLTSVKVFVDAVEVGAIQANQNGIATVPTSWFPNGPHQIWVAAVNEGVAVDTDGNGVVDDVSPFEQWASLSVNFTNEAYMENYSPLYTAFSSITMQYSTISTQNYTFEVFKINGTLLHTTNGQINGSLSRTWDFTDLSGNLVNDGRFVFSLTYSPPGASPSAAKKILMTNLFDTGVSVGKYIVSFGTWSNSAINVTLSNLNTFVSVRVNAAAFYDEDIIGTDREDYNPPYVDFSSDPFPIRRATQTNDLVALTNAIKDVVTGSWLFDGHSSGGTMIHGGDNYLAVNLTAEDIANLLGTTYQGGFSSNPLFFSVVKYGRRLFSTMMTGCSAATIDGWWPDATGTPIGVNQLGNPQIKKSAFVGFNHLSSTSSTKMNWIARIHQVWIDLSTYDTALQTAVDIANADYPAVQSWGPTVHGYRFLEYSGDDSR